MIKLPKKSFFGVSNEVVFYLDFLIETLDEKGIDQNWFKHIRELNKGWQKKF